MFRKRIDCEYSKLRAIQAVRQETHIAGIREAKEVVDKAEEKGKHCFRTSMTLTDYQRTKVPATCIIIHKKETGQYIVIIKERDPKLYVMDMWFRDDLMGDSSPEWVGVFTSKGRAIQAVPAILKDVNDAWGAENYYQAKDITITEVVSNRYSSNPSSHFGPTWYGDGTLAFPKEGTT